MGRTVRLAVYNNTYTQYQHIANVLLVVNSCYQYLFLLYCHFQGLIHTVDKSARVASFSHNMVAMATAPITQH